MLLVSTTQKAVWAPQTGWTLCPYQQPNLSSSDAVPAYPSQYNSYDLPAPVDFILHQVNPLAAESRHITIWVQGLLTLRPLWQMDVIFWDSLHQTKDAEGLPLPDHITRWYTWLFWHLCHVSTDSVMETDGLPIHRHLPSVKPPPTILHFALRLEQLSFSLPMWKHHNVPWGYLFNIVLVVTWSDPHQQRDPATTKKGKSLGVH